MSRDIGFLPASSLYTEFRARRLSPVEVLEAQIANDEREGALINPFSERLYDSARKEAKQAEKRFLTGCDKESLPALLGITVATKEKHQIAGHRLEQGLLGHEQVIGTYDHPVVQRLRQAGAIIHARTTTPEFSCATVTHSELWGVTRNPWNPDYSPGGSSGGAAAALSIGATTLATASDIAGSTRLPASFTGNVGFKAPYGMIPADGPLSGDWYRGDGPLARSVADTAILTNVLAGVHCRDPSSYPALPLSLDVSPGPRLRIGVSARFGDYQVDRDIESNMYRVVEVLSAQGHTVVPVELPFASRKVHETAFAHFGSILATAMEPAVKKAGRIADYTKHFLAEARAAAQRQGLLKSMEYEYEVHRILAKAFSEVDLIICPVSAVAALEADGHFTEGLEVNGNYLDYYWQAHMTLPFNLANRHPALAIPSGMTRFGIPSGVQLVGPPHMSERVFRVGYELEQIEQWHHRMPPTTYQTRLTKEN